MHCAEVGSQQRCETQLRNQWLATTGLMIKPNKLKPNTNMKIQSYKSDIFITITFFKDGTTTKDGFASLESAKEYRDELMQIDSIKEVSIMELLSVSTK